MATINTKSIQQASYFPIRFKYPLDLNGTYNYTRDGYSLYYYSFLDGTNDVAMQKDSSVLLTQKKNINEFYKSKKFQTETFNLGTFAYVKFNKSGRFITGERSPLIKTEYKYYPNDMVFFRKNDDNTVSIILRGLFFTVDRYAPFKVSLAAENKNDIYNQQKFEYSIGVENNNLLLSTIVYDTRNRLIKRYLSYSPVDFGLRAIGVQYGDFTLNEYYLTLIRNEDETIYRPDFLSESYVVEYYNKVGDYSARSLNISNKIPINQANYIIHLPYKSDSDLVVNEQNEQYFELPVDVVTLKNILTPANTVVKIVEPPVIQDFNPGSIFFEPVIKVNNNNNVLNINGNNIPFKTITGKFPNNINTNYINRIPISINLSYYGGINIKSAQPTLTLSRTIGIAANGVEFKNPASTAYEKLTSYNFDLVFTNLSGLDFAGGFPDQQNKYNYYTGQFLDNGCWDDIFVLNKYYQSSSVHSDGHSKIIGIAYDGYPIYGPYGYTEPLDSRSAVKLMESGYTPMTYAQLSATERPPLSSFPLGTFVQDNVFTGVGTLDKYNGRYCVTPEYPRGTYAYFITQKNSIPIYPYIIGNEFYGSTDLYTSIDPTTNTITRPRVPVYITVVKQDQRVSNDIVSTGNNKDGQLVYGNLATQFSTNFNTISFKKAKWTKISAGYDHVLALSGSKFYVGGKNVSGQIGQGALILQSKLTNIPGNYTDIFAGPQVSFALSGSDLYGTGSNINYQLGNAKINRSTTLYNFVFLGTEFKKLAVGGEHTLAIKLDSRLYSTGRNSFGQLGDGDVYGPTVFKSTFIQNRDFRTWSDIACGLYHSLAITTDKKLFVAGNNDFGQLGTGNNSLYGTLYQIPGEWDKVICGKNSSYALSGNNLYVTGDNQYGQIGLGDLNRTNIWIKIPGEFKNVAAGVSHAIAVGTNNVLYVTGYNFSGELGLGNKAKYTTWTPLLLQPLDGDWDLLAAGNQTSYATVSSTYFVEVTSTAIQS